MGNLDKTERRALHSVPIDPVTHDAEVGEQLWALSQDLIIHAGYNGVMLRANPAAQAVFGEKLSFLGELDGRGDTAAARRAVEEARETGRPTRITLSLRGADDRHREITWSIAPHPSRQSFFAVGRDVTEVAAASARIRETEERLAQMQQTETLGQLASGVAHDFNNLLVPIIAALDSVRKLPGKDAKFDKLIDGAAHAALSARDMVRRMLDFAQERSQRLEPVETCALLYGMHDLLAHTLTPAIELCIECEDDVPPVLAHPSQLELAILNLAVNARDAMPDGGKIVMHARRCDIGAEIVVVDRGCGMDEAAVKRATEAFYTTKPQGKGTGLGLFMVARIANAAGGKLTIDSVPGKGTTVRLALPAAP